MKLMWRLVFFLCVGVPSGFIIVLLMLQGGQEHDRKYLGKFPNDLTKNDLGNKKFPPVQMSLQSGVDDPLKINSSGQKDIQNLSKILFKSEKLLHGSPDSNKLQTSIIKKHSETLKRSKKVPRVYIYSLPEKFNKHIQDCVSPVFEWTRVRCFNLRTYGFGHLLYEDGDMGVYNTEQFSLEVIIHNQLLYSKYRTLDPEKADVFYIPSYLGILPYCHQKEFGRIEDDLFTFIKTMPYFKAGKPHLSTIAKIERESAASNPSILNHKDSHHVTYIAIEKEAKDENRRYFNLFQNKILVAPYPSYVHRNSTLAKSQDIDSPSLSSRRVFLFFASSMRRTNPFRNIIIDQFETKLKGESFENYFSDTKTPRSKQIMLITSECMPDHVNITVKWMQNSVFCVQPPGDSPTRKSFYDSIQSGCVPVIFTFSDENVEYPFQRVLKYSDFVFKIDASMLTVNRRNMTVFDILKTVPQKDIDRLHNNVIRVARQLQYSHPLTVANVPNHLDSLDMIMDEVAYIYKL